MKIPVDFHELQALGKHAQEIGTEGAFITLALQWCEAMNNAWNEARSVLIACDSELSANGHGRTPSPKEELLALSDKCRKLYEGNEP